MKISDLIKIAEDKGLPLNVAVAIFRQQQPKNYDCEMRLNQDRCVYLIHPDGTTEPMEAEDLSVGVLQALETAIAHRRLFAPNTKKRRALAVLREIKKSIKESQSIREVVFDCDYEGTITEICDGAVRRDLNGWVTINAKIEYFKGER